MKLQSAANYPVSAFLSKQFTFFFFRARAGWFFAPRVKPQNVGGVPLCKTNQNLAYIIARGGLHRCAGARATGVIDAVPGLLSAQNLASLPAGD